MLSNVPQPCASIPGGLSDTALDKRPSWTECKTCLFAWPSHRPRVNDWGTSLAFCAVVNRRRRTCNDTGTPLCAHSYAKVAKLYYILVPGMACFLVPKMGTRTDPKATPMKGSSITYPILAHFWYPISGLICVPVFGTFFVRLKRWCFGSGTATRSKPPMQVRIWFGCAGQGTGFLMRRLSWDHSLEVQSHRILGCHLGAACQQTRMVLACLRLRWCVQLSPLRVRVAIWSPRASPEVQTAVQDAPTVTEVLVSANACSARHRDF